MHIQKVWPLEMVYGAGDFVMWWWQCHVSDLLFLNWKVGF